MSKREAVVGCRRHKTMSRTCWMMLLCKVRVSGSLFSLKQWVVERQAESRRRNFELLATGRPPPTLPSPNRVDGDDALDADIAASRGKREREREGEEDGDARQVYSFSHDGH